jgi:hypothetical protein
MAGIKSESKKILAKIAALFLVLVLLTAGLWMLICVLTLFSVSDYFTVGHFIAAGIVICIAGQWLTNLEAWQHSASEG